MFLSPRPALRFLLKPGLGRLLLLIFAQQVIFFGYESLLGLFTLTRLGFLGRGNAALFLLIGLILVTVQLRFIGRWSARLGDRRLASVALGLLSLGLLLTATTPDSPHPLYLRELAQRDLLGARQSAAEAYIGDLAIELPANENRSLAGVIWLSVAIVPLSIGAGLIRPTLNSLITQRASPSDYGRVLGVSAALVSGANACAPLVAGWLFLAGGSERALRHWGRLDGAALPCQTCGLPKGLRAWSDAILRFRASL